MKGAAHTWLIKTLRQGHPLVNFLVLTRLSLDTLQRHSHHQHYRQCQPRNHLHSCAALQFAMWTSPSENHYSHSNVKSCSSAASFKLILIATISFRFMLSQTSALKLSTMWRLVLTYPQEIKREAPVISSSPFFFHTLFYELLFLHSSLS